MPTLEKTVADDANIIIPTHHGDIVLPVMKSSRNLSMCLIEVGCKPVGKHTQLKTRRELLFRHFKINIGMLFSVYRGFVYYNGERGLLVNYSETPERVKPDFSIHYLFIPENNLAMNSMEREYVMLGTSRQYQAELNNALDNRDSSYIERLLKETNTRRAVALSNFKGRLMEHICFTDIAMERLQHPTIPLNSMYLNQHLNLKNRHFRDHGTEVDMMIAFYDDRVLKKLLGGLEQRAHLELHYKSGSRHRMFAR